MKKRTCRSLGIRGEVRYGMLTSSHSHAVQSPCRSVVQIVGPGDEVVEEILLVVEVVEQGSTDKSVAPKGVVPKDSRKSGSIRSPCRRSPKVAAAEPKVVVSRER